MKLIKAQNELIVDKEMLCETDEKKMVFILFANTGPGVLYFKNRALESLELDITHNEVKCCTESCHVRLLY